MKWREFTKLSNICSFFWLWSDRGGRKPSQNGAEPWMAEPKRPMDGPKERVLESNTQRLRCTNLSRLGPEPNHYTSRKTLAPEQPQRLSFQAEHQTGNPNAETVPVQRQGRQNRKTRNRFPGLLSHGQTLADPPAL